MGLKALRTKADGDCLFHALDFFLNLTDIVEARKKTVAWLRDNAERQIPSLQVCLLFIVQGL